MVAEKMLFSEKQKRFALGVISVVIVVLVFVFVYFLYIKRENETSTVPETLRPTMAPTFDNRPTLQIVQERGSVSELLYLSTVFFFADTSIFF